METLISQLPTPQAQKCATFTPPLDLLADPTATVTDVYEWNAIHNPNHPLFIFDDDGVAKSISWKEANQGVHRAAHYFTNYLPSHCNDTNVPTVIAMLATLDSITFGCSLIGSIRAGFVAFLISPRNSSEAIAHLLTESNSKALFISADRPMADLAEAAVKQLQRDSTTSPIDVHPMPVFEDLFPPQPDLDFKPFLPRKMNLDAPAFILHSSGSTSFPKPIISRHRTIMYACKRPWYGAIDLAGIILSCHALPTYHGFGTYQLFVVASCGAIIATFRPQFPAVIASPDNVFDGIVTTKSDFAFCVPSFFEQWLQVPEKVAHMAKMKGVLFGGGPLSKPVGDSLVSKGVRLHQILGSTEAGAMNPFISECLGPDWEYVQISDQINHEFVHRGDETYELIVFANERWSPNAINTKLGEYDAFATNDLFVRHPTKPGLWKIYGRADDQIMLSTGEKTNPGPIEKALCQDPHIKGSVVFGRAKFQNGVLIDPKTEYAFDPKDEIKLEEFRNAIWPTVERMNISAPQHSRIFKEMIIVSSPSKPVEYTGKNSPRRRPTLKQYDEEIKALYERVESVQGGNVLLSSTWSSEENRRFIREVVHGIMKHKVTDDEDLFQFGCDSLQATWIRIKILRALREFDAKATRNLDPNFVFQEPSITRIAHLIYNTIHPSTPLVKTGYSRDEKLLSIIEKYTSSFRARPKDLIDRNEDGDVVLLTGTTGGLGCNILAHLSLNPSVKRVYALNRSSSSGSLMKRQVDALDKRGLLEECLGSPKFDLFEVDLSLPGFGLEPESYERIRTTVTHIIHNAWPVDFNLSLSSFEKSLQGVRGLVDIALASPYQTPPSVLFVSSIGIFGDNFKGPALEEHITDPNFIALSGYAESKWVSERILYKAAEQTGLRTTVVRSGQICSDRNGYWNEKEWFPSIVKSALTVKCLPDVDGEGLVSWIPSYDAAAAVVKMRHSNEQVLHLVSPNPVPWRTFLKPLSEALDVPLVSYATWLEAMENSLKDNNASEIELVAQNPGLQLLSFYRRAASRKGDEPLGVVRLDTTKSQKAATSLTEVKMDAYWVEKWVKAWTRSGFLSTSENVKERIGK